MVPDTNDAAKPARKEAKRSVYNCIQSKGKYHTRALKFNHLGVKPSPFAVPSRLNEAHANGSISSTLDAPDVHGQRWYAS